MPAAYINGISGYALILFFFIALSISLWIYFTRRRTANLIHPDNQQDVHLIRQRSQSSGDASDSFNHSHSRRTETRYDACPICLNEPPSFQVQTNCGHCFCGKCIITFWKFQSNWISGMTCPVCRQQVTVLLTGFTSHEQNSSGNTDRVSVTKDVKDFNRRFSGAPRTYLEYFHDIPVLIPHILRHIFSLQGILWVHRLRILVIVLATFAYVASPIDILPESILGFFGLFDDFLIMIIGAIRIIITFRQSLAQL